MTEPQWQGQGQYDSYAAPTGGYGPPAQDPYRGYQPHAPYQSRLNPDQERTWASAAHWGSFLAAWVALGVFGPLLVLLVKGDDSPYVRWHAVESLNFQLSALLYALVGGFMSVVLAVGTLGIALVLIIPLILAFAVGYLVVVILGAVRASQSRYFRYPLTMRLVK